MRLIHQLIRIKQAVQLKSNVQRGRRKDNHSIILMVIGRDHIHIRTNGIQRIGFYTSGTWAMPEIDRAPVERSPLIRTNKTLLIPSPQLIIVLILELLKTGAGSIENFLKGSSPSKLRNPISLREHHILPGQTMIMLHRGSIQFPHTCHYEVVCPIIYIVLKIFNQICPTTKLNKLRSYFFKIHPLTST